MKHIGNCPECGAENVKVVHFDDGSVLCEACIDLLTPYQKCDICGEYYDPGFIEFAILKDGRFICEYCMDKIEEKQ